MRTGLARATAMISARERSFDKDIVEEGVFCYSDSLAEQRDERFYRTKGDH